MQYTQLATITILVLHFGAHAMAPATFTLEHKYQDALIAVEADPYVYVNTITERINAHPLLKEIIDDQDSALAIIDYLHAGSLKRAQEFPKEIIAITLNSSGALTWVKDYIKNNKQAHYNLTCFLVDICQCEDPNLLWAERMLQVGISPNALDKGGNPCEIITESPAEALTSATNSNHVDLVALLLRYGANIEVKSPFHQNTALIVAAQNNSQALVKLLLDHNANPNATNVNGTTPLIWATKMRHFENFKLLLAAQADISIKNADGESASEPAAKIEKF